MSAPSSPVAATATVAYADLPSDFDKRLFPTCVHKVRVLDRGTQVDVLITQMGERFVCYARGWGAFTVDVNHGPRIKYLGQLTREVSFYDGTQMMLLWALMHEHEKVLGTHVVDVAPFRKGLSAGTGPEERDLMFHCEDVLH